MVDDVINFNIKFLSTPSARRATDYCNNRFDDPEFLSTPSARRATWLKHAHCHGFFVFLSTPSARRATPPALWYTRRAYKNFYPRPPRGGRPAQLKKRQTVREFLSTPSARRATGRNNRPAAPSDISIHALREEGD